MPTLIRWEWVRAPVIQEWKKRSGVRWDATEGSNRGAERAAWKTSLEMEKYNDNVQDLGMVSR